MKNVKYTGHERVVKLGQEKECQANHEGICSEEQQQFGSIWNQYPRAKLALEQSKEDANSSSKNER